MVQSVYGKTVGLTTPMDQGEDFSRTGFRGLLVQSSDARKTAQQTISPNDHNGFGVWGSQFQSARNFKAMHNN